MSGAAPTLCCGGPRTISLCLPSMASDPPLRHVTTWLPFTTCPPCAVASSNVRARQALAAAAYSNRMGICIVPNQLQKL